ncbi:carboxymuconolactone decarboxylase family protein [Enteractinococcus coprophilus]|uniref:AhpD family alkylhydroperoxidase n=1 Tax=Enteractinococcus coprophilus TaxID=1027633 RepID=A0A543AFX7_9MICC|nr:carboxymuconolactone decarboxylase family protein [Enteractinococcus coprophilus]TQL71462.1 AhpD family alkylhydroperoxidase [Enteractinococcus coprophilus]
MASRDPLQFYLDKSNPDAWKAVTRLVKIVGEDARAAGLSEQLIELVNLRVSQLNGCAFCLALHTRSALKVGISSQRLGALPAWWEAGNLYTETERAALQLAEQVTQISDIDSVQAAQLVSSAHLTEAQYAAVQWLAMAMNLTNRISILSHHPVKPSKETQSALEETL